MPFWVGLGISLAWVTIVLAVVGKAGAAHSFGGVALADWAVGISAAVSPVAMVWMVTAYLQRATDIQTITDPLRRQLTLITGESGAADARIRRFNQAIREQIELLRSAQNVSQEDMEAVMDRVQQHRADLERFENVSTQQVKEIQDVVRRSMFQIEQMMDDKFTMLRVLDGKLQQNGEGFARQVETVGGQVAQMLEDVEKTSTQIADALDRAQRDSQKLSETSRLQEASLTTAAESAAETLGGLSSKIDLSVARFLERASTAREEATQMAQALDAQTRTLDDFSVTLPARVSEAESVLRGVADRLYASEQFAREQAVNLSEKLSHQVDGLQNFMNRFAEGFNEIGSGINRRQGDLKDLAERIDTTATGFFGSWEKSIDNLNDRMGNSLLRFTVVNDETRRNAESVSAHLTDTTGKYEDVVTRMHALSTDSSAQMKTMTEEVVSHLSQFEKLSAASAHAGEEVQKRANDALQNLQHVLDRVLAARDATHSVGQALVKDIGEAVNQNEKMIQRLNETAQLGARAISAATENLGRQEGEILGKARASEAVLLETVQKLQTQAETAGKSLREQTVSLMNLLAEAQGQMSATDQKLQSFAAQAVAPVQKAVERLDASAEQGLRTLGNFGEGLSAQVERLQEFHTRIGGLSQDMTKTTAESAGAFESLGDRFAKVRASQEETARHMLSQFSAMSDSLRHEVTSLDNQAAQAIEVLQQAAMLVGEQSHQMMEKAQSSGTQITEVATSLQAEAAQIQAVIRRQTDGVGAELSRAEEKFNMLSEVIREKANAAHALIDLTAAHYGDVSEKLEANVETAHGKVETLNAALTRQSDQIEASASKIEKHAVEITAAGNNAVDRLSILKEKMIDTHDAAVAHSNKAIDKLDETTTAFQNSTTAMIVSAQTAADAVIKSSDTLDEKADKLVNCGQQIAGVLNELTQATSALSEKASTIRHSMEQQNSRLLMQLTDSVSQLDSTGNEFRKLITAVTEGSDKASARFNEMTEVADKRISSTTQELYTTAERVEKTLSELGVNITQQAATMTIVGDQIGEQQKTLFDANEKQRVQLLDLFDRLTVAHKQASDVAEKTISYLSQSLTEIDHQVGDVSDRSQTAIGNIKIASAGFSDQSALLLQNAQAAEQQARTVLQVTSALQEQASQLRASLQSESQRAGESLGALLSRLTTGGTEVREMGTSTNVVLSNLQRALSSQTAELNTEMEKIGERQRTLTVALDAQRETIGNLLNRLTAAQDQTASAAERTVSRLTEGAKQIAQNVEVIDARTQDALNHVQKASAGFSYETEVIGKNAQLAVADAQQVLASATTMREQIDTLRNSIREEGDSTGNMLSSLLSKVKLGAEDIRSASVLTETSLTNFNANVTQHSAVLAESVKTLDERQTSLVSSLNAQRDTIGGLLSRFAQAQEETVTVAERTASRLNEEAQSIATSIDLIGAQASTTLASVQASVSGFAEQAVAIKLQGQQAEEQVRNMMSATSGMQDHAKAMRDSIQSETGRVVELLSSVIDKLDTATNQLKTQDSETTKDLDQTTQRLSSVTQVGADLLQTQTQALNVAMDQAETRMSQANAKACEQMKQVIEASDKAEAKTQTLANAAEFATKRLVSLRDTMAETDKEGRDTAVNAFGRIEEVKALLKDQMQHLVDESQKAVEQVSGATQTLVTQSDALRANLSSSESALTEAANLVREEAKQIPATLNRGVSEIEAATRLFKSHTTEVDQAMVGTADRFISVTAHARENLAEEMKNVSSIADDAGKILDGFNQLLVEQVASLRQNTAMLSGEQQDLVEKASLGVTSLAEASQRLLALRTEAISTAERLVQEFDILDQRAAMTGGRLAQAGEGISKQVEAISVATANAEGRITSVGDTLRDQLDRIRGGLQGQIDEISRGLLQITAQLERTGANLRSTAVGAVADVERVGQRFGETGSAAASQVAAETERMRKATEDVETILGGFSEKFDQMIDHMAQAGADIKYQEGTAIEHLQRMLGQLGSIAEKLEGAKALSGDVSQRAIERLDEVVTAVQSQMSKLTSGAQTAAGIMRGIGQIYSDQTGSLTKGVGEAHNQVLSMNKSIDDMQRRTDHMRAALKMQGEDLMNSMRTILNQLESTGDGLSDAVHRRLEEQQATKRVI
ncbi:MAG: hypothetical protein WC521_02550 [Bdellovibrionales bacterium]